ncbi:General stress protein 13 [Sporomusa ovata DSM 2662]|uniref:RNA binding protein, contains ribosomal protein S1 domain n=2 Tax=Sporomusa ovata TaxID=2378 RepID=A0A0U1KZX9_9FIRM|nr:RNA binding S1 domain containing protein [Sporomusa ovata DSM 2662]CQR72946.1 RNA binding protein, contains ribosomal protein S1 domain [Sporomusa ovata]
MISMSIEVGSVVEGVVTGITNFGAFVELPGGKVGLIHISEVADVYVRDVKDFLKEQDKVKVKVLSVDDRGKIGLSIKQLQPPAPRKPHTNDFRRSNRVNSLTFEDKLSKFLKDSDERQSDLKRSTDSKRGGSGGRGGAGGGAGAGGVAH